MPAETVPLMRVVLCLAHRLYRPMATLSDVAREIGLTENEIARAVARFKERANVAQVVDVADLGKATDKPAPKKGERPAPPGMKRCKICGNAKPLAQFSKDKGTADGKNRSCKPCDNAYQAERKAARAAGDIRKPGAA